MSGHTIRDSDIAEIKSRITLSDLIGRTVKLKRVGREFVGLSPFQTEKSPSFTVNDEKQFYHCFSSGHNGDAISWVQHTDGVSFTEAVNRLASETGVTIGPVVVPEKPRGEKTGARKLVAEYVYHDRDGDPYHKVERYEFEGGGKTFTQSHWEETDHIWISGTGPNPPVPYNLPAIIANPNEPIWLVEGEKNADDLIARGLIATTAKGGATAFPASEDFAVWFDGATVYALPDNDEPGQTWLSRVQQAIPHVITVTIPGLPPKGDVSDWLDAGGTVAELKAMAEYRHESETETPTTPRVTATPFQWADPQDIPRRPRLYGDHLFRKFTSLLVSPGGLGKSSLALVEALAMTSGRAILKDDQPKTPDPLTVWYWNGEDPQEETQRRVVAAAKHHGLKPSDFASRLYTDTGRETQITLGQMQRGEITLDESLFEALENEIIARGIDVFTLDPFVSSHRMGENDNNAIDAIVKRLNRLADRCNCAVELVHHVRKPAGGSSVATDVNDARGASALLGAVRSARVLNVMSEDIADLAKIDTNDRFSYFSVSSGKSNMSKRTGDSKWRFLHDFDLCNGSVDESDHVGVVEYFRPPDGLSDVPDNAAAIAQDVATRHPEARYDRRSGDWFGHFVGPAIGMSSIEKNPAAVLSKLIDKWLASGVLIKRMAQDQNRKMREFIASPDDIQPAQHFTAEVDDDCPF